MVARVSPEQWDALRALRRGEAPTIARLAAAAGLPQAAVRERAQEDAWPKRPSAQKQRRGAGSAPAREREHANDGAAEASGMLANGEGAESRPVAARPARRRRGSLSAAVASQIEAIVADAEAGRLDKGRIDAVLSMIRMNAEATRLQTEKKTKKTMRSDEQLADTMRRIDERIVELAVGLAERMGARRDPS